jgi:dihydrofolate reductase
MGKIIVAAMLSVDGYAEGAGGDLSVMPMSEAFNEHNAERLLAAESLLYGATTYRQMLGYWPGVPDEDGHSPAEQEIAARMADGMPVTVVSDSLTEDETGAWRGQTTIVRRDDAHRAVAALRERDGDALVFGSMTLWTDLLAHGLVDELHLMLGPKLVAGDARAFTGVPTTDLRLLGVEQRDQTVVIRYGVGG